MTYRCLVYALSILSIAACTLGEPDAEEPGSDEPDDYIVDPADGKGDGIAATFDQNDLVGNDLFLDDGSFTADEVQKFFEASPYGRRSWLADYTTPSGVTAAQAVYRAAKSEGVSPMMLIARMQVEASLVSRADRPSATRLGAALGCGCPDGSACSASYRGFDAQLVCGAKTLRKWYDASVAGTGQWRVGKTTESLDNKNVTPRNHATASLYSYTPWVLVGRGGGWLVWNVTRKYVRHAEDAGYIGSAHD